MLFSASSAALSFAFDKLLNVTYSLIYGGGAAVTHDMCCLPTLHAVCQALCVACAEVTCNFASAGCFGSSLIGVLLVTRAVRRSGKASALVLILAGVIGLGAVLTGALGIASPASTILLFVAVAGELQGPMLAARVPSQTNGLH